jgi:serine protease AprX
LSALVFALASVSGCVKRIALVLALLVPAPALAAAPRADLAALHGGTAIVQFAGKRAGFVTQLRAAGLDAVVLRRLPFAAVGGPRALLLRAARLPGAVAVHMDRRVEFELHESIPMSYEGSAQKRAASLAAGFDGRGVNVAVVDTGTDGLHPDLRNRVVRNVKVLDAKGLVDNQPLPSAPVYAECPVACTTDTSGGHGTHVSGIVAGDGTASGGYNTGMAPGAGLVGLSIGDGATTFYALQAWDYLLAHQAELHVVAVNNSYGPGGGVWDAADPMNVGSKKLHDAGIAVVFSGGNAGAGSGTDPVGASNCSPDIPPADPVFGSECKTNPWGLSPWAISVANGRKDQPGGPEMQPISFGTSRGDPVPRKSKDGKYVIDYRPWIVAPGTNIISARSLNGAAQLLSCGGSAEPASCQNERPEDLPYYTPLSGSSMAAPHVVGAIAVIESAAKAKLGRLLTPDEVKDLLADTAVKMKGKDLMYDWPICPPSCGTPYGAMTGKPYEKWQVGAGYLDVEAAVTEVVKRAKGWGTTVSLKPPRTTSLKFCGPSPTSAPSNDALRSR